MIQLGIHGVFVNEIPTSIKAPVTSPSGMPVFIGAAPSHRAADPSAAYNRPVLAFSYQEACDALGYSDNWDTWTLCEAMYSQFKLYGVAPAVFYNVFDPTKNVAAAPGGAFTVRNGRAEIPDGLAIPGSIKVYDKEGGSQCEENTDYVLALTGNGLVVTVLPEGLLSSASTLWAEYSTVDPSSVAKAQILEAVEAIETVFPKTRLVPGHVLAPKWDEDSEIRLALIAKAKRINGLFKCMAIVDIPENAGEKYSDIPAWKEANGLNSEFCIPCWGRPKQGGRVYHLSTQIAGLLGAVDNRWGGVPFASPSNNALSMDAMDWKGKEVWLGQDQAGYLGANGIVTALNWIGGWHAWGNRTAAYPGVTDPKDMWISVRRVFNWFANELILTYWQDVSLPVRSVLIDNIVTSLNTRLAGLTAMGYFNGGRVEWEASQNPLTNIIDGKISFHVSIAPPPPAETIEFRQEYDPAYFEALAASIGGA